MYDKISLIKKLRELPVTTANYASTVDTVAFGVTNIRATVGLKEAKDFVEEVEAAVIEDYKANLSKPKPIEFKMGDKVRSDNYPVGATFVVLNRHDVSGYVGIDEVPIVRLLTGEILFTPKHLLTKVC